MKVAVADDNALMRKSIAERLSGRSDINVVGIFNDGQDIFDWLCAAELEILPDIILMDIEMPTNGILITKEIRVLFPDIDIVMLTVFDDDNAVFEAIKAGAVGYLLKEESSEAIIKALNDIRKGGASLSPSIARKIMRTFYHPGNEKKEAANPLTNRETEILELISTGVTNPQIAEKLFISYETVRKHVRNIYEKLQVTNRTMAAKKALDNNWIGNGGNTKKN